ncbi:WhiB family transcriptional regulator [Mycobacterium sp. pUA109]|uniref:WhiB family transcriptional regulator n=1 Tax=Mycobacterium sp. pUA109 TaxID=3238982 RepID=UPI00351ACD59
MKLLAKILADTPKLDGAACVDNADVFDADDGDWELAVAICRSCPALTDCGDWADGLRASDRPAGVVAGQVNRPRTEVAQ